ncbi:MAG TPA: sigma-70 family RNA polymerase sigma factor [Ginsengibacter sp.]|nr:sigma-70 family RNA polymerase sigma factor [Ginsengibacter sp.]
MQVITQAKPMKINLTVQQIVDGLKEDDDLKRLRLFQHQFFHKFKGYIYKIAIHRCLSFHDSQEMATDITQQTFINAFRKIKDFDLSKEPDQSKHEVIIKAWLGTIANNCFNKEYTKRKAQVYLDDLKSKPEVGEYDMFESLYGDEPIEIPNEFRSKLRQAMMQLTDVQRHVIEIYAGEDCINSTKKLSPEKLNYLCKIFETSSDNIRQTKKRALDKIKKICSQTNK